MDFHPDPELDAFRATIQNFLDMELPAKLAHIPRGMSSPPEATRCWQRILNDHWMGAPSWDLDHGGTGWSVAQQLIFDEECMLAGAPTQDNFAQKLLGPVLNKYATPEQWQAHVPPILTGERLWCQGFSEPGSGSDLASLRTRAERRGDDYAVSGQKIWTTNAHRADWIFLLARTDSQGRKQAGISFFLVDLASPGITVRPIVSIDGCHHLNEVFFDDVAVPAGNLVGGEGMGWAITKFLLNNEHATTADLPTLQAYLREMKRLAVAERLGENSLIEHQEYAVQVARFEAELKAVAMMVQRAAALHGDQGREAHALGSMLKLRATDLQQRMTAFLVELLGDRGATRFPAYSETFDPAESRPSTGFAHEAAAEMFFRRAATIYGGTSEVQRGIVAKLMFGF
jgi:acyl-CoA dehydrogenase